MKYWKQEDMGRIKMCNYSEYVEQRAAEKAREERDREMIGMKLRKGRTPAWIHEEDEYPMELIMDVKALLEEEDVKKSITRGEDKVAQLSLFLLREKRYDDLLNLTDGERREKLFHEFGMDDWYSRHQ